jgi:hypothetical protein
MILDHCVYTYNKLTSQNKNTYEAKLNTVVSQMKTVNDNLDEVRLKLEKTKEIHRELKELYSMQYEEKTQRITEKRILHQQQINAIRRDIHNEECTKKNLVNESSVIIGKMKEIMHIKNLVLANNIS